MYMYRKASEPRKQLKHYSFHSSIKFPPLLKVHWSWYQLTPPSTVHSVLSLVGLSYYMMNAEGLMGFKNR